MTIKRIYYNIRRHISNLCFHFRQRFGIPDPVDFKYVDIVFENCNAVRIPSRLVDCLCMNDIGKDIFTNWSQQFITLDYCKDFSITLKNEALNIKTHFQESFKDDERNSFEHHLKVYKDITHIAVKKNRGKELYIGVPYKTKDMYDCSPNLLQKNKFHEDNFTVSCKEQKHNVWSRTA